MIGKGGKQLFFLSLFKYEYKSKDILADKIPAGFSRVMVHHTTAIITITKGHISTVQMFLELFD